LSSQEDLLETKEKEIELEIQALIASLLANGDLDCDKWLVIMLVAIYYKVKHQSNKENGMTKSEPIETVRDSSIQKKNQHHTDGVKSTRIQQPPIVNTPPADPPIRD
jgi:hypothetical protein